MRKSVIATLLLVSLLFSLHYALAYTQYDKYKSEITSAEKRKSGYEKENAVLQKYLDAVDSGDREKWEEARKSSAFLNATMFHKDLDEVEAVKAQIATNNWMIEYENYKIELNKTKMDIYYHGYILKDTESINAVLNNGNRSIPSDISGNVYYSWPNTELPNGLFTDQAVIQKSRGDVFFAPATILSKSFSGDKAYYVDIYGTKVDAVFHCEDEIEIGDTVNIYFCVMSMLSETTAIIMVGDDEETIDIYRHMRTGN